MIEQTVAPRVPTYPEAEPERYQNASPFPHIMIDNFFPEERVREVAREIEAAKIDPEAPGYGWLDKRRVSDLEKMPPKTRKMVEELNSRPFLEWLERLTGIEGLQPDPYLEGGGIHQIPPGGYLKIHTDFNWHRRLGLHRRINALLYLNEDWQEEWGGQLELWDEKDISSEDGKASAAFSPLFNRMVIFSTTDFSYHGHPHELQCPPDRTRNSIALYYYSKERPASEIKFDRSEMTNYRERPNEQLGLKHKIHQVLIRQPFLRGIMNRLRRSS